MRLISFRRFKKQCKQVRKAGSSRMVGLIRLYYNFKYDECGWGGKCTEANCPVMQKCKDMEYYKNWNYWRVKMSRGGIWEG